MNGFSFFYVWFLTKLYDYWFKNLEQYMHNYMLSFPFLLYGNFMLLYTYEESVSRQLVNNGTDNLSAWSLAQR